MPAKPVTANTLENFNYLSLGEFAYERGKPHVANLPSAGFDFDFAILTKAYRFHQIVKGYVRIVDSIPSPNRCIPPNPSLPHPVIIDSSSTLHQFITYLD